MVGAKDRATNKVAAKVVSSTDKETLQGFVKDYAAPGATVYSNDAGANESLPFDHATVKHSLSEYVKGGVHTNGIESPWSMLKRAHKGTFHKLSPKHLDRYVQEFAGRHNIRELDTLKQLGAIGDGMAGKRLRYRQLIADNGLPSGARSNPASPSRWMSSTRPISRAGRNCGKTFAWTQPSRKRLRRPSRPSRFATSSHRSETASRCR